MNNFIKKLRDLTEKEETYSSSQIEVRVKENPNSEFGRETFIYLREEISDSNLYQGTTARIRATNIEDGKDFIEYRLHALPGGRAGFGGYLYPEDLDKNKMKFYSFGDFWYAFFGEIISYQRKFTIDELKGVLQIFRARIEDAKYQCLYEVKYKDSYEGIRKFRGPKYFAGTKMDETRQFNQIEGEDNIKLEEVFTIYNTVSEINMKIGKGDSVKLGQCYGGTMTESNNDTPFELINVYSVFKKGRVYDDPYFTKEALSKIVEKREKERGI